MIGELAGLRSFQRGVGYLNDRRVESAAASDKGVRLTVRGTMPYDVELWLDAERLAEIVLQQAADDWRLRERLLLEARSEHGIGPDLDEWRQIDPKDDGWSSDVSRLREAMIGWALAMDDPDALVEAHRRERIHPTDMVEIAAAFERAGRDDESVEWARRCLSGTGHRLMARCPRTSCLTTLPPRPQQQSS